MEQACNKTEKDFEILLTKFNEQNEFLKDNILRIDDKLNSLKSEPNTNEIKQGDQDTGGDIISAFNTYLDRMNNLNLRLQRAGDKFNELV